MFKGSDVLGKPVVAYDTGEKLCHVQDLIFDQENNQLLAFLLQESGWFYEAQVLLLEDVQAIGVDAVIAPSRSSVLPASKAPSVKAILKRNNILKSTHIMTTDGQNLGQMIDLYFDERTGAVEGYQVSGGLFADAYTGKSFVPAPKTLKIGEHVAFVPPEVATMMEEQVGGIKGAMLVASERVQEAAQSTGESLQEAKRQAQLSVTNAVVEPIEQKRFVVGKVAQRDVVTLDGLTLVRQGQVVTLQEAELAEERGELDRLYRATGGSVRQRAGEKIQGAAQTAGTRLQQTAETARDRAHLAANSLAAGYTVEQALGRRVMRMVRANGGFIVAAEGQIVTQPVIDRAKTYRVEQKLLEAVGLSTNDASRLAARQGFSTTGDRVNTTAQAVGDRLSYGAAQVKISARSVWEQLKESAHDLQDRWQEQRIKGALGRPVTRVILDTSDNVILNVGDLVTHEAIAVAYQAGVLDVLLDSIYTKTPHLSEAELRAPKPAIAALEPSDAAPPAPSTVTVNTYSN